MKHLCFISSFLFLVSFAQAKFNCPTQEKEPSKKNIEDSLQIGTVWTRGFSGADLDAKMIFVDSSDKGGEENKKDYQNWKGVFKVGYSGVGAKECRRQLVIGQKVKDATMETGLSTGVYDGWMIVEVCDPQLKNIPLDKIPALQISNDQKKSGAVQYIEKNDRSKTLSKRFKVKVDFIYFYESEEGCVLKTVTNADVAKYGGIASEYTWGYSYKDKLSIQTWHFDDNGNIITSEKILGK